MNYGLVGFNSRNKFLKNPIHPPLGHLDPFNLLVGVDEVHDLAFYLDLVESVAASKGELPSSAARLCLCVPPTVASHYRAPKGRGGGECLDEEEAE
jgi:hypothetical protein